MFPFPRWYFTMFLFCFSLHFAVNSSTPLCHPNQKLILLDFRNSFTTNIPGPMDQSCPYPLQLIQSRSSTTGDDCCDWDWISCDPSNNHVVSIDLHCSGLKGNVNSLHILFRLDRLQSVILSQNYITGELPSSLNNSERLVDLWELNLANNFQYGNVPSWVTSLPSLQTLHLDSNNFTGSLVDVLGNASGSLQEVGLSGNDFYGSIPELIFENLVNLTYLDLSSNNLNGSVELVHIFSKLKYLTSLDLSDNSLSVVPTRGYELNGTSIWPNLTSLGLSSCKLSEFPFLGAVGELVWLKLSNNDIQGAIPTWIREMGKSKMSYYGSMWIDLSNNSIVEGLENLPWDRLLSIDISSNLLQGTLPSSSFNRQLNFLLASNNKLDGTLENSICNLTSLVVLDLSNNTFSGEVPVCLGNTSPSLQVLNLGSNKLSGSIPQNFSECDQLSSLDLSENRLDGVIPRSLVRCTNLQALNFGNNMLVDTFPSWLDSYSNLRVLNLRYNKLYGHVTSTENVKPQSFAKLQILDLSSNSFGGELPSAYINRFSAMMNVTEHPGSPQYLGSSSTGYFSVELTFKGNIVTYVKIIATMVIIDISNNEIGGEIPNSIGGLVSLRGLNLSHNQLTSKIPPSLANLALLEFLDLSLNRLIGEIPQELVSLTYLGVFNVSENQLTGPIPRGNNFDTYSTNSYEGNLNLCGSPLPECKNDGNSEPGLEKGDASDKDYSGYWSILPEWEIILMGYGCGTFLGLIWGSYMLSIGKPIWLVKFAKTVASTFD